MTAWTDILLHAKSVQAVANSLRALTSPAQIRLERICIDPKSMQDSPT